MNATHPTVDAPGRRLLSDACFHGSGLLKASEGDMLLHHDLLGLAVMWIDSLKDSSDGARLEALLPGVVDSLGALVMNWRRIGPGQAIRKTQAEQVAAERLRIAIQCIPELLGEIGLPLNWNSEPWRYREYLRANRSADKEAAEMAWRRRYPSE